MTTYKTRADLMQHPAFAELGTDTSGNPCVWENYYSCRVCSSEQEDWSDVWSCQCDDECPDCGRACEPEESVWIGPEDADLQKLWESLPEA